jgi:gliding motility-associated-like protein
LCIGSELRLTGSGAVSYVWDMGIVDGIAFIPENIDSTVYTVIGTDSIECTSSASFTLDLIDCEAIGVPSAFSPNGDGNNDILLVKGAGFKAMHFVVYNRYGEVVFETWDQNYGWNGNFKNTPLNPAVYTWTLQYDLLNGASGLQKGNTTLIL